MITHSVRDIETGSSRELTSVRLNELSRREYSKKLNQKAASI